MKTIIKQLKNYNANNLKYETNINAQLKSIPEL